MSLLYCEKAELPVLHSMIHPAVIIILCLTQYTITIHEEFECYFPKSLMYVLRLGTYSTVLYFQE
jgi:hypothetical protein